MKHFILLKTVFINKNWTSSSQNMDFWLLGVIKNLYVGPI